MTETIDTIAAVIILLGGLIITLIGFEIIKLKSKNSKDEERMIYWRKKFGKFFKIGGIVILIIGILLLFTPDSDYESVNWTQSQKKEMIQKVINSSDFLQSINPDTANLVATCFVDKYTERFTLQESWEQDKMTKEKIIELTMPILKDCFQIYDIKTDE